MKRITYLFALALLLLAKPAEAQWMRVSDDLNGFLTSIVFTTPTIGYVTGDSLGVPFLAMSTDRGRSWRHILRQDDKNMEFKAVDFGDASVGVIVGIDGDEPLLLRTTDAGVSWTRIVDSLPEKGAISMIDFATRDVVYASGWNSKSQRPFFLKSTDGGSTWTHREMTSFVDVFITDIDFVDADHGFAGGVDIGADLFGPLLMGTTTGGRAWDAHIYDTAPVIVAMEGVDSRKAFATSSSTLYATVDGGSRWDSIAYNVDSLIMSDVLFLDGDRGYAVGTLERDGRDEPYVATTKNGGRSWVKQSVDAEGSLRKIAMAPGGEIFAIGPDGTIVALSTRPASVDDEVAAGAIAIAPNPARESFIVSLGEMGGVGELRVHSMHGELVRRQSITAGASQAIVDTRELPAGVYVVELRIGSSVSRRTVVIGER